MSHHGVSHSYFKVIVYFIQSSSEAALNKDVNMTSDAFFLIVGRLLVYALAPLTTLPFLTDSCIIPYIEKLLGKDINYTKSSKGKSLAYSGNRGKVVRWFDILWAFLEVGHFVQFYKLQENLAIN